MCVYKEMGAAANQEQEAMERHLRNLKNSRRGKKISITKRIKQLEQLVEQYAGRKRISFLLDALRTVFEELQVLCDEISTLSDDDDVHNDIEEIRFNVENCIAEVTDHLDARADEPLTTSSLTSSWVAKHAAGAAFVSPEGSVAESRTEDKEHEKGTEETLAVDTVMKLPHGGSVDLGKHDSSKLSLNPSLGGLPPFAAFPRAPGTPARVLPQIPANRNLYVGIDYASSDDTGDERPLIGPLGALALGDRPTDNHLPSSSLSNTAVPLFAAGAGLSDSSMTGDGKNFCAEEIGKVERSGTSVDFLMVVMLNMEMVIWMVWKTRRSETQV